MKPEEYILEVKKGNTRPFYIFSGDNKYVVDRYIEFAAGKGYEVVDADIAYYELSNRSLFGDTKKYVVCRLENGEAGKKQLQALTSLHSAKILLLLSSKQLNQENEVYFSTTAGISEAEKYCKAHSIKGFPTKESVEEFGLYKTMLELSKIPILQQSHKDFTIEDLLPLSEKPGGELKIFDLDFSDFVDFEEYPMSSKIERDVLIMIRIRELIGKDINEIKRISGIGNEKMIYLFQRYAKKYTMNQLEDLYVYFDNLRIWLRSGMREGYFRDLVIQRLVEISGR